MARPLGTPDMPGVWVAGRRMVAVDGTCLDVADTPANDGYFGRAGVNKGERAAFPMARVLAVAESGTHAIFAARVGTYRESEPALAADLLPAAVEAGMLPAADRGFFSYALWRVCCDSGALWRIRTDRFGPVPEHLEDLPDGSWLAHLRRATPAAARGAEPMLVRVIDYTLDDGRDQEPVTYRLFTTLLDPEQAPATELAVAYAQRWEIENASDELKTHPHGASTPEHTGQSTCPPSSLASTKT